MIDPNISFIFTPEGTDALNATGMSILQTSTDGIFYNYHVSMIEYTLLAIFGLMAIWFAIWFYFKFTRSMSK